MKYTFKTILGAFWTLLVVGCDELTLLFVIPRNEGSSQEALQRLSTKKTQSMSLRGTKQPH